MNLTRRTFLARTGSTAGLGALAGLGGLAGVGSRVAYAAATDSTLAFQPAFALAALLRDGQIGSVELTRHFIDRIERFDKMLNAVVVRDFERALAAAEQADSLRARGELAGPLHGLPMTIKESFDLAGFPSTWGNPAWRDRLAERDARVVTQLKAAGAHFLGKTNVPFMLGDFQSYNDIYGTTGNPWDPQRTPGGSSGGSAAALAAGMTGLEYGSDIGGSIRNPAHFCGVFGHKPTWNIVSPEGQAPPGAVGGADLAVVGPLARSARDLRLALDLTAGADRFNERGWRLELPPPRMRSLSGLRVALLADHPASPVSAEVRARVEDLGERLSGLGAKVSRNAPPEFLDDRYFEVYSALLLSVIGTQPEDNIDHQRWMGLHSARNGYRLGWQDYFRDWDVLVCPIMPTTAFPHDHSDLNTRSLIVDGEPVPYFQQLFWAGIATLCYLPATVFPTGTGTGGLPIGLQAIGAEFDDRTTIEFARLVEDALGGFQPPPGYLS